MRPRSPAIASCPLPAAASRYRVPAGARRRARCRGHDVPRPGPDRDEADGLRARHHDSGGPAGADHDAGAWHGVRHRRPRHRPSQRPAPSLPHRLPHGAARLTGHILRLRLSLSALSRSGISSFSAPVGFVRHFCRCRLATVGLRCATALLITASPIRRSARALRRLPVPSRARRRTRNPVRVDSCGSWVPSAL
jgi:hypothetical protein